MLELDLENLLKWFLVLAGIFVLLILMAVTQVIVKVTGMICKDDKRIVYVADRERSFFDGHAYLHLVKEGGTDSVYVHDPRCELCKRENNNERNGENGIHGAGREEHERGYEARGKGGHRFGDAQHGAGPAEHVPGAEPAQATSR